MQTELLVEEVFQRAQFYLCTELFAFNLRFDPFYIWKGDAVILGMMYYWFIEALLNLISVLIGAAKVNDMVSTTTPIILK